VDGSEPDLRSEQMDKVPVMKKHKGKMVRPCGLLWRNQQMNWEISNRHSTGWAPFHNDNPPKPI